MVVLFCTVFLVSVSFGSSPFNAVQILLLNILWNFTCAFAQIGELPVISNMPQQLKLG
jgi:magnesium-transporting ATPase (P-type)